MGPSHLLTVFPGCANKPRVRQKAGFTARRGAARSGEEDSGGSSGDVGEVELSRDVRLTGGSVLLGNREALTRCRRLTTGRLRRFPLGTVGPRPAVRPQIREITAKERVALWGPFRTPAPIRWAPAAGGNSGDYSRLAVIPCSGAHETTARLQRRRDAPGLSSGSERRRDTTGRRRGIKNSPSCTFSRFINFNVCFLQLMISYTCRINTGQHEIQFGFTTSQRRLRPPGQGSSGRGSC